MTLFAGLDVGSTTVKLVVMDEEQTILYKEYDRHLSMVRERATAMLQKAALLLSGKEIYLAITGSAGLGLAKVTETPFVQEVYSARLAVDNYMPDTDVVIELGGEDAKIIFLTGGSEERMNGSCAGGTGAFIDQMATFLGISTAELDRLALRHERVYNIASRCGVFAKSDIQSLLNKGARKEDIAASIYRAVVEQTVTGLAQGRRITGNIAFLGGPLTFQKGLRQSFVVTLGLNKEQVRLPQNSEYFVAIGAALYSRHTHSRKIEDILEAFKTGTDVYDTANSLPPLFNNEEELAAFRLRHAENGVKELNIADYQGDAYLGIDAGSTTTKMVLISDQKEILYHFYQGNSGEPLQKIKEELAALLRLCADRVTIKGAAVTGYGEDLIKEAFCLDTGLVETVAHFLAARHFNPHVDFILDIGGQDIKCIKIKNQAIDSLMLNEACSSGCGSFIETFAKALGYSIADFAELGLMSKHPVNLGSRCTVFMNSSVKQAQKDGAGLDDISAGLAISVIKNAIYKVIRVNSADSLGQNIVVQGGTFLNDAVLRSFEQEIGRPVVRPSIAGLMGAYGSALYALDLGLEKSSLLTLEQIEKFTHTYKNVTCKGCTNNCTLTINTFNGEQHFISGNRCEKPLPHKAEVQLPNAYQMKQEYFRKHFAPVKGWRGRIGIPLGMNMYENMPFWHAFFTNLGYEVINSGFSTRDMYVAGQHTIPSDTVCYPAKLLHGHIEKLLDAGLDTIFYPCLPHNFEEGRGTNNYNCPVVAHYPELLYANVESLRHIRFLHPYLSLQDEKNFIKQFALFFVKNFNVSRREVARAARAAYRAYDEYKEDLYAFGRETLDFARQNNYPVIILAGRPYHMDPEINHGIDKVVSSLGLVVLSEDCINYPQKTTKVSVLNQWTYHSRLYAAAHYVAKHPDMQLIQLVSFGCGLDAITSDEVREILERAGKLYTQLKIDEISDSGAAKIRIRSLIAAMQEQSKREKKRKKEVDAAL